MTEIRPFAPERLNPLPTSPITQRPGPLVPQPRLPRKDCRRPSSKSRRDLCPTTPGRVGPRLADVLFVSSPSLVSLSVSLYPTVLDPYGPYGSGPLIPPLLPLAPSRGNGVPSRRLRTRVLSPDHRLREKLQSTFPCDRVEFLCVCLIIVFCFGVAEGIRRVHVRSVLDGSRS